MASSSHLSSLSSSLLSSSLQLLYTTGQAPGLERLLGLEGRQEGEASGQQTGCRKEKHEEEISYEVAPSINIIKEQDYKEQVNSKAVVQKHSQDKEDLKEKEPKEQANSISVEKKHSQDKEDLLKCKCPSVIKHSNPALCPIRTVEGDEKIYEDDFVTLKKSKHNYSNMFEHFIENVKDSQDTIVFRKEDDMLKKSTSYDTTESAIVQFVHRKTRNGKILTSALINNVSFKCNKERKGRLWFRCAYYYIDRCNATFFASTFFSEKSGKEELCAESLEKATRHNHDTASALSRQIIYRARAALKVEIRNNPSGKTKKDVYTNFLRDYSKTLSDNEKLIFVEKFPTYKALKQTMWKWKKE